MRMKKKLLLTITSCFLFCLFAMAQTTNITGIIKGPDNNPLVGVTVHVKGTNITTVTGDNGSFSIGVPDHARVLIFSYVGDETQEVFISGKKYFQIQLKTLANSLNDVVVVGYGTQRKIDLTGSVSSVSSEELLKRPATNAIDLLQGKVAGLDITQPSGQPGEDAPSILIRGLGTFGASAAPLILIDGVQGNLNNISPDDIASVSVLKDAASASIYGSLAANGVILVTTKRGAAGGFHVDYTSNYGSDQATRLPSLVYNSALYMQMFNEAREHSGYTDVYTQDEINAYKTAPANSIQYPNFNWINYLFRNADRQNQHISINGGNDKTTYNFSLGDQTQSGIIPGNYYKRWNAMLNLDSRISKIFKVGATMQYNYGNILQPWLTGNNLVLLIYHAAPTYMPYLPDGSGRIANGDYPASFPGQRSPITVIDNGGQNENTYEARSQGYIEADILKGLTWMGKAAFDYNDAFNKIINYPVNEYNYQLPAGASDYTLNDNGYPSSPGVTDQDDRNILLTVYSTLNYEHTFAGAHHLNAMVGYEQDSYRDDNLSGNRNSFPSNTLTEINAGASAGQYVNGDASEWAIRSYFGRLNYSYLDKYLLQANFRYDGSSRLSPTGRWGLFPSVSAGWLLSKENFMKNVSWLNELKLRGSYGELGNQLIGDYPYQSLYNVVSYPFGSSLEQGAQQTALVDQNIKWEKTNVLDFGTDIDIRNGLFTATIDWYRKVTNGILAQQAVPADIGLSGPITNYGSMQNVGWEFDIGHRNSIGKNFHYGVNFIFSTYKNKVLTLSGGTQDEGMFLNKVGIPYGSYYLTQWIGIFNDSAEIAQSPTQPFTPKPGDLKYKDVSGPNGKPDGVINADDRVVTKGAFPSYTYSFNLNLSYKNWSLTAFFQGMEGGKAYVNGWGVDPFYQSAPPPTYFKNSWTPQNLNQKIPALYVQGYAPDDGTASTYFLQNASYLRLKNLYIGYQLPTNIAGKIRMKQVVVYVSGDNLLTFTKYQGADPETALVGGSGRYAEYPQVRTFSGGININF